MSVALDVRQPVSVVCREWQATDVLAHAHASARKASREAAIRWAQTVQGGYVVNAAINDPKALGQMLTEAKASAGLLSAPAQATEAQHQAGVALLSALGGGR